MFRARPVATPSKITDGERKRRIKDDDMPRFPLSMKKGILPKGGIVLFLVGLGEKNSEERTCEKYCCFPWKVSTEQREDLKTHLTIFLTQLSPSTLRASLINCQLKKGVSTPREVSFSLLPETTHRF